MTTRRSVLLVCTCLVLVLIAAGVLSGWIAPSERRPGDSASELGLGSQPPHRAEFVTPEDNGPAPLKSFSNVLPALDSEPGVPVLFEALLRAVDASDGPAARSFRERLLARGQDEVRAEALRLPAVQRQTPLTAGSPRTEQVSTRARLSNLLFFVAPLMPDAAFEELRKRWSDPLIAEDNLKRWHEVEKLPVDHLACVALDVHVKWRRSRSAAFWRTIWPGAVTEAARCIRGSP